MVKLDIVRRIAVRLAISDDEAHRVVDEIMERIKDTINQTGRLELRDFGVFQVKVRKPRTGRNPRDMKEYPIPPRRVVTFRLGKDLRDFALAGLAKDSPAQPSPPPGEPVSPPLPE